MLNDSVCEFPRPENAPTGCHPTRVCCAAGFGACRQPPHTRAASRSARSRKGVPILMVIMKAQDTPSQCARLESMELLTSGEIARLTPPERLALIAQLCDSL